MKSLTAIALLVLTAGTLWGQTAPPRESSEMYDVDIRTIARLVSEKTGAKYVFSNAGGGTNVVRYFAQTDSAQALYQQFLVTLGILNLAPIPAEDGITYIVERGTLTAPLWTKEAGPQDYVTKLVPLQNISAIEVRNLMENMTGAGGRRVVTTFPDSNYILLTETVDSIRRMEALIRELDKPGVARTIEVIPLKHVPAQAVADQLTQAIRLGRPARATAQEITQMKDDGRSSLPSGAGVFASPLGNSVIVVGTTLQQAEIKALLEKLDVEPEGGGKMNAIFLKYLTAEDASKSLNALLAKTVAKDQRYPIAIEHSSANNALIVDAAPQDFAVISNLVEKLDQPPQQVLVEVVIAEAAVGNLKDIGVELDTIQEPKEGKNIAMGRSRPGATDTLSEILQGNLYPQGLALGITRGSTTQADGTIVPNMPFLIRALAQDRDVKILSSVPLWAQNNVEAVVNVVDNIPVLRSTIEGGSGTSRDVIQNIDRVDVGIKLKLTPHVNPDREVLLKLNPSIEAITSQGTAEQPYAPTIAKREVSTTITVPDRSTVVISGLMREDNVETISKVPLLGDIPILGWFFRSKSAERKKTNLLIFVTPHIVTDVQEATRVRKLLENRTGIAEPQGLNAQPAPAAPSVP